MSNSTSSNNLYGEIRQLVKLALPLLTAHVLISAVGVVDSLMSGRYSALDLAGVAVGSGIWLPVSLFVSGLLIASTAMVARYCGGGNKGAVAQTVQQSIWLALLMSVPAFFLLSNSEPLLRLLKVDEDLMAITDGYLSAIAFGLPGLAIFSGLRSFAEGLGRTKPFMFSSLMAFFLNIILNYGLIYGRWGMPELGGVGCGWATAISMWAQALLMLWFTSKSTSFDGIKLFKKLYLPSVPILKHIFSVGFPISIAVFAEVSIFSVIALLLAPMGATIVAGHQIALSMSHLFFMVPLSLSQAITCR